MRVIFLNHSTAPVNLGGAERSLLRLVEEWAALRPDFEPFFITKAPAGQFIAALKDRGLPFEAIRFRGWALPSRQPAPPSEVATFATTDYAAVRKMIQVMERIRPDLVVTNTLVAPWAALAAASLGIPHAWFVREYGDLDHGLNFQTGRASTLHDIGLLSQAVVTNSFAVREHLSEHIDAEKISVAYPQVDLEKALGQSREEAAVLPFPQAAAGLKVTVVGRVEHGKGQHRVIDAVGALKAAGITASLCIVGSWTQPGYDLELLDRARGLGVADHVVFVGEQSNPFPFIAAADVAVTPSTIEAFGRSTLEYMAVGRPVVASSSGGSAELVQVGVTGSLFDIDEPSTLFEALKVYADSPALAREHGKAGAVRIRQLLSGELGNGPVVDRLEALVGGPSYRLPDMARYWFALPEAFSAVGATSSKMMVGLVVSRLRTRTGLVGRILRRPRVAARRLLDR